ncbi:MAG: ribose transport system substrate-binding protein [Thermoanaerobaculia bacterium]|jgi:ribose transport system substrate-binding protein|nr:ribose transport system substrate-binding protein [Thermoanaerobaculia bacterium]
MKRILIAIAILFLACSKTEQKTGKSFTLAVIPQGSTHEFWKSIHAGAMKAAQDEAKAGVNVTIIWKGPMREDDREQQVQVVEGFVTQHVNGIVLAPFDKNALVRPVEEAKRAGIPTVVVDSGLESADPISFVASNNYHGGELAADEMGRLLGGKGKVLALRYQEGVFSTEQREKGFIERIKAAYPSIELLSSNQFAGATRDTAKTAAENLLNRFGNDINGLFTPNESSTAGALLALEDAGKAGKIRFIGFDTSDVFVKAMRDGKLQGIVVQNPFRMGELGVKTVVAHLLGKPIEKRIDTGVTLITPATLDAAESQTLLHPPLETYLK